VEYAELASCGGRSHLFAGGVPPLLRDFAAAVRLFFLLGQSFLKGEVVALKVDEIGRSFTEVLSGHVDQLRLKGTVLLFQLELGRVFDVADALVFFQDGLSLAASARLLRLH